jgi:hypothetical protein
MYNPHICSQEKMGRCYHPLVPPTKGFFGSTPQHCVEDQDYSERYRLINPRCKIKVPYPKPDLPPPQPPPSKI